VITYRRFFGLRLSHFVPNVRLVTLSNWEYMGKLWIGEAVGFTEWLRLIERPDELRSVSIDLQEIDPTVAQKMFSEFDLPVAKGLRLADLERTLGASIASEDFLPDRRSYLFHVGDPDVYHIDCTIHKTLGLIYVVIMTPLQVS